MMRRASDKSNEMSISSVDTSPKFSPYMEVQGKVKEFPGDEFASFVPRGGLKEVFSEEFVEKGSQIDQGKWHP